MHKPLSFVRRSRRLVIFVALIVALVGSLLPAAAFAAAGPVSVEGNRRPNHGWNEPSRPSRNDHNYSRPSHSDWRPVKACDTTYRVRRGDTLSEISKHFRVSIHAIAQKNGIRNVNRIIAGSVLVFIVCLGFYITPELLGGGRTILVSMLVQRDVEIFHQWGAASASAVVLLAVVFAIFWAINRFVPVERILGVR